MPALAQSGTPVMGAILPRYQTAKMNMVEAAQAMPEESYNYKLTPAQRSFGEWIEHNAGMNYSMCAQITGKPASDAPKVTATSPKAELVKALESSFAFCDSAFQSMTDEKAVQPVTLGSRQYVPVNIMVALLTNWYGHYGNMVGYLRTKGITPPSTARSQKK
ncbi:MAG: DinB family protein [Bryobacteraceae bacterium]|nr:DinB family protein [Bryobacteraceae bacterium]